MSNVNRVELDSYLYTRPYDFKDSSFTDPQGHVHKQFTVYFYLLLVREKDSVCVHTFLRNSDLLENAQIVHELGLEHKCFNHHIIVDQYSFTSIFNEINSFLEYVHQSS